MYKLGRVKLGFDLSGFSDELSADQYMINLCGGLLYKSSTNAEWKKYFPEISYFCCGVEENNFHLGFLDFLFFLVNDENEDISLGEAREIAEEWEKSLLLSKSKWERYFQKLLTVNVELDNEEDWEDCAEEE